MSNEPILRQLTISDLDSSEHLEFVGFPPNERASREKVYI